MADDSSTLVLNVDGQDAARSVAARLKATEQALKESEARSRRLFEANPHPMWVYDLATLAFLDVNDAAVAHYGYTRDEFLAMTVDDIVAGGDEPRLAATLAASGRPIGESSVSRHRTSNGSTITVELTAHALEFSGRHTQLVLAQDITDRKRAEGQLRLQSAALNAAAHSMLITDRDGIIAWINPAFTELTGYSAAEAIGRNPRDLIKSGRHDAQFYEELWATILAGHVWHGEVTNRRKDGSCYPEDQTITPVKDAHGQITHFIAIQRDLTGQRQLETQLLQAQKMEAIGTLAGGIAHDFNNILGAILGFAELATASAAGNEALLRDLREVTAAGRRATDLVRQILTFSRREEPARQPIRLNSVVREALKLLRASLPASIEFRSTLDPATPPVLADPTQVHQIIMNLGTNAWHAMKDRSGVLDVTLGPVDTDAAFVKAHVGFRAGRYARLSVRDTGHGMDAARQERIFDPFFTTKAPGEGTGLGLATVHGIMKSHAGEILVDSRPGHGTVFHLYFPALEVAAPDADAADTSVPRGRGQRILFVDDEAGLVAWGTRALESLGYAVTGKQSVVEALALVTEHPEAFDLIVTDLTMPAMTGIVFATRVWAVRPGLPVILTTGFTATLTADAVRQLGLAALVLKPTGIKTLAEVVQRVLQTVDS